jgi:hypothetical protein
MEDIRKATGLRPGGGVRLLLLCEADVRNAGVDIRFFYKIL